MEVLLFPGSVRVEEGWRVMLPVESFMPAQNVVPKFALSKVNVLGLPDWAPFLSHVNWTLETVTEV